MADVDILGPWERRRIWSAAAKAALLAEIDAEGGKVRLVARRRGVSESLLYNWRSARKAAAVAAGAPEDVQFVAVGVLGGKAPGGPALLAPPEPIPAPEPPPAEGKGGSIEITFPNGARVRVDAFVDNNIAENAMRCIAVGRKNYRFAGSDSVGERAASIYTLVRTAKLNDVNPETYLRDLLTKIAEEHTINKIDALLPWNITPQN